MKEIEKGDVVMLKSGGPPLTVLRVWNIFGWKLVRCIAYNGVSCVCKRHIFRRYLLPLSVLKKTNKATGG